MPTLWGRASQLVLAFAAACAGSAAAQVNEETISFERDGLTFSGILRTPAAPGPWPLLVLYHAASGGSSDFGFYAHLKDELPRRGVATFVYDRRGTGGQPGDFETASFEDLADDGLAAVASLISHPHIDRSRIGAWGVSQGGWIAPLAALRSPDLAFAVSVSGPGVSPARQMAFTAEYHLREAGFSDDVVRTALDLRSRIDQYFRAPEQRAALQSLIDRHRSAEWFPLAFLPNGGNLPADVTRSKWHFEMDFDPTETLASLRKPLLFVFGAQDRWVPVEASMAAIRAAVPDETRVTFYVSERSGHLMSGAPESEDYMGEGPVEPEYVDFLISWIGRLPR